jgi:uroporphyrin-III C-methyltransferase
VPRPVRALRAASIEANASAARVRARCERAAAAARIALTHRDASSVVSFVAGQCKGLTEQDWAGLAGKGRTLVIYMGVKTAPEIAEKLMADGLAPDVPVAVVVGYRGETPLARPLARPRAVAAGALEVGRRRPRVVPVASACARAGSSPCSSSWCCSRGRWAC